MTGLEELIIVPGDDVTDAGVAHLAGLKRLRLLLITNSKLTDDGLISFGSLADMEWLLIEGQGFSDQGLAHVRGMTRLKLLALTEPRQRKRHPRITDDGLKALAGMTELSKVMLHVSQVSDEGIDRLLGLKKLKTISLDGAKITETGRKRLKAAGVHFE
jgi:internalin A